MDEIVEEKTTRLLAKPFSNANKSAEKNIFANLQKT